MLSKEELHDLYITQNLSKKEIARRTGVHSTSILYATKKYGLVKDSKAQAEVVAASRFRKITATHAELEQLYIAENKSKTEIASLFGATHTAVHYALKAANISKDPVVSRALNTQNRIGKGRNTAVHKKCINRVDPLFNYVAGWIATDGHLYRKAVRIALKSSDLAALETIAWIMGLDRTSVRKIANNKCEINLSSTDLVEYLVEHYGMVIGNKTFTLRAPAKFESEDCARLYLRGALEGDGTIKRDKEYPVTNIVSASPEFIDDLVRAILQYAGVTATVYSEKMKSGNLLYKASLYGKKALVFLDWLYSGHDQFRLERKFKRYKSFCREEIYTGKQINHRYMI